MHHFARVAMVHARDVADAVVATLRDPQSRTVREIAEACAPNGPFEAIFVNDGSTDATADRIAELRTEFPWLREVRHAKPCGQSAAVRSGVLAAVAPIVCTIDGDGQNPPAEIPALVAPLLAGTEGVGLVAGQRVDRQDTASKKIASRLANRLRAVNHYVATQLRGMA